MEARPASRPTEDVAVTACSALDAEHELPPAASPIEMTGAEFQIEAPAGGDRRSAPLRTRSREATLVAGNRGLLAVAIFEVQETGLYTISAFVRPGPGQRWVLDGCRKAVVCAERRGEAGARS